MSEDLRPSRTLVRAREEAATALTGAFADDELDVDEFEARLDRCWRAGSFEEIEALFDDLTVTAPVLREDATAERRSGPGSTSSPAPSEGPEALSRPVDRPGHDLVLAVMSGVGRGGRWTPPRHVNAVAVMGGVELDFRQARFPPGETTVNAVAFMGGVEIVVPPGVAVTCAGVPIMGGFERLDQEDDGRTAPGAVLRIRGAAVMGGVEVRTARPGEEPPGSSG